MNHFKTMEISENTPSKRQKVNADELLIRGDHEKILFHPWESPMINASTAHGSIIHNNIASGTQHKKAAVSLKYNDEGNMLAVASADKKCCIYDTTSGNLITTLDGEHTLGLNDCAWISDRFLATASDDKTTKVWDIEAGKVVSNCCGHKSFVYCLNVHPETRLLYTGGYDGSIRVFHAPSSSSIMNFSGHAGAVVSIHHSPSNGQDFVTGSHDGVCRIWDSANPSYCKRSIFSDHAPGISGVKYSPNGKYLLVSTLNHEINLYPTFGETPAIGAGAVKHYVGHTNARYTLQSAFYSTDKKSAIHPHNYIINGSEDNLIYVWDADTMRVVQTMKGHSDVVLAVACNPNAAMTQIASAGRDSLVKLWKYKI